MLFISALRVAYYFHPISVYPQNKLPEMYVLYKIFDEATFVHSYIIRVSTQYIFMALQILSGIHLDL